MFLYYHRLRLERLSTVYLQTLNDILEFFSVCFLSYQLHLIPQTMLSVWVMVSVLSLSLVFVVRLLRLQNT
jgi:phosphatidylserine synthase